jgi:hypothetical protein
VKRRDLERHLRAHGCESVGGTKHEKWQPSRACGGVARHNEIAWPLALKVRRDLEIPPPVASR